jgi:hypothetical protein
MSLHASDLERILATSQVDFPETPALASRVTAAIAQAPRVEARPRRLLPILAAAAVLAIALTLLASPAAREAVADWLGIGGVRITTQEPGESSTPIGNDLGLGEPVTLAEARSDAGFDLRFPVGLGPPDETYLATAEGFSQVNAVYGPPLEMAVGVPGSDERLLLTQFVGSPDGAYFKKLIEVDPGIDQVMVDGLPGLWLASHHEITYRGPDGTLHKDTSRLAGKTLLWEENGITYRLESSLSKVAAVRVAEDLE